LTGRGGVADGGLFVQAEHDRQVQRVGSVGQCFFQLPVDAQSFQSGDQAPGSVGDPDLADRPGLHRALLVDDQMRVRGVGPARPAVLQPAENRPAGEFVQGACMASDDDAAVAQVDVVQQQLADGLRACGVDRGQGQGEPRHRGIRGGDGLANVVRLKRLGDPVGLSADADPGRWVAEDRVRESGHTLDADAVWTALETAVGQPQLTDALDAVEELTVDQGDPDAAARAELLDRFPTIRKAVASLAAEVPFGAAEGDSAVLAEFQRLPQLFPAQCRKLTTAQISAELVGSSWRRLVLGNPDLAADQVDRRAYISAVTEAFHSRLRRGDVFVHNVLRWADPRAKLLDEAQWQAAKPNVLTSLELPEQPETHLAELTGKLDIAYRVVADRAQEGTDQPATVTEGTSTAVRCAVPRVFAMSELV
jgi:hypothetical protein